MLVQILVRTTVRSISVYLNNLVYDLEHKILKDSYDFKYIPKIKFNGSRLECRTKYNKL